MPPTCSSTRWCRTRLTARYCASPDAHFTLASRKFGKLDFRRSPKASPNYWRVTAAEAGLIEKAAWFWGKAGQRSLERSAVVEASEQLKRALDQIATLAADPALRREQLKLQVALANALMQLKGYAAPEPKVAFEQARLLIERAEALGEAPEDPLLLFSVLWGVWSGSYVKFNGEAIKAIASQFLWRSPNGKEPPLP